MKRQITVFILPFMALLLCSCISNQVIANYPFLQKKDENITLLFSDDDYLNEEGTYYDAILEIKKNHPNITPSIHIVHSSERDLIQFYNISKYPTLLVIHNEHVALRIEGSLKKEEIINKFEKILLD